MSEISSIGDARPAGTLLWVGDRHAAEFREPFQYCETNVAQLALRADFVDAARRPAAMVQRILIARGTRGPIDASAMVELSQRYPDAAVMRLLGTLCEGDRTYHDRSKLPTHNWYRWMQVLPQWLAPCIHQPGTPHRGSTRGTARSVAVVASTASTAEPLMELATMGGAAVAWCRRGEMFRARNFDAVWWDDSVAKPTTPELWRERLRRAESGNGHDSRRDRQRHAWLVQSPRIDHYRHAIEGGVDVVVSKPGRIECLLAMLASADSAPGTKSQPDRRAPVEEAQAA